MTELEHFCANAECTYHAVMVEPETVSIRWDESLQTQTETKIDSKFVFRNWWHTEQLWFCQECTADRLSPRVDI